MPKLNTLISVGFCSSYGDGDFAISGTVIDMDKEKYDELRLAVLSALNCADDMRKDHRRRMGIGEFSQAYTQNPTAS